MYRCFLCCPWASRSAFYWARAVPFIAASQTLSLVFLVLWRKLLISSPFPRTQCSTSSRWRNWFRPSGYLVTKFVLMFSHAVGVLMVLPYQSAAGPLKREEKRAFLRKVNLAKASGLAGASPRAKLIFHSISCMKDSAPSTSVSATKFGDGQFKVC